MAKAKTQEELLEELKCAVNDNDEAAVHVAYDTIIEKELKRTNPKLLTKLNRIRKGMIFFYGG